MVDRSRNTTRRVDDDEVMFYRWLMLL